MTITERSLLDRLNEAVAAVCDPEFPDVTIADLGILEDVRLDAEGNAEIDLIPTFLGCPALDIIESDVRRAAESVVGVSSVDIRFRNDPVWTPERITDEGRRNLAGLTIAVRDPFGEAVCPVCGSQQVVEQSPFGPTACRAIAFCVDCRNPVEVVRQ